MNPLSVAASAAGLLSLGITIAQTLIDFYSPYKYQQSDVAHTIEKLERLLDVLSSLCGQCAFPVAPNVHVLQTPQTGGLSH